LPVSAVHVAVESVTRRTGSPIFSTGIVDPSFSSVQSEAAMPMASSLLATAARAGACAPCSV